jgi:hypothetical protein
MDADDKTKDQDDDRADGKAGLPDEAINRIAKAERRRREAAEAKVLELEEKIAQAAKASLSEQERREKDAIAKVRSEVAAEWEPKLKAEKTARMVERKLLSMNADPEAIVFLDLAAIEDEAEAEEAVGALLVRKPHLILGKSSPDDRPAQQGGAPRRGSAADSGTATITESQVRAWTRDPEMYKKKKHEIAAALRDGRVISG